MIQVSGMSFQLKDEWKLGSIERMIIQQMLYTSVLYSYLDTNELLFEVKVRKHIIESAEKMSKSEALFTTFEYATCNGDYWYLTKQGGFLLKPNVSPSEAITDILKNSSLYAFECATACVIIFYQAILKSIGESQFISLFQNLYLYSWHSDPDLGLYTFYATDYLPGDVVYFNNPDYSPKTPWYRGVNAVAMGDSKFFGHGFGIRTDISFIDFLNEVRLSGSNQPAYLTNLVTRPSFKFNNYRIDRKQQYTVIHHNRSSISFIQYLYTLYKKMNR